MPAKVRHLVYARLWLGADARAALTRAEFWELRFMDGAVSATGREGNFDPVLHAMSALGRRGVELEARWTGVCNALGGFWRRAPFNLGEAAAMTMRRGTRRSP